MTAEHQAGPLVPESPPATVRIAPAVAWVDIDPARDPGAPDTVVLARVPQGPPMVLSGSAAQIWRAVLTHELVRDVLAEVRDAVTDSPDDLDGLVLAFLGELQTAGLVVLTPCPSRA